LTRTSGILLPVSALPSRYGIGTMGKAARDFVDFLHRAGQGVWQVLPIGPTSYGNSPYQSYSVFAGNLNYIDLDALIRAGLLKRQEVEACNFGSDPRHVDYDRLYAARTALLRLAFRRGRDKADAAFGQFCTDNAAWLPDYALFMAARAHFGMRPWTEWDADLRLRRPEALARYHAELAEDVAFHTYVQYLFYVQWTALREYAHAHGVRILGDLPIYTAMDSADVWAAPSFFQLDENAVPTAVAGVPPDYFSETGQLWGNPLYDWDAMEADGFGWWIRRLDHAMRLFDLTRIDHFRGLASYWSVPYGAKTAAEGKWVPGPGLPFLQRLQGWFGELPILAEDLGILTEDVRALLRDSGLPGMRVLQFAFDPEADSDYLPHHHVPNTVCYTGTHDNTTLAAWAAALPPRERRFAMEYLGVSDRHQLAEAVLRAGMGSVADLFVAQMQDWLRLGAEARTNVPGTTVGNWAWRLLPGEADAKLAARIRRMTRLYGRLAEPDTKS